ncbi:phosphoribosyltransferase [Adhaeribacter aquaticus]|uniref:phosphoribosyltransferase n=1 Tax=Adhaeribacter aquaticus TaxID=299567 RepID=UPI000479AC6B|nr:phosphoribosyltransferase family protein [Adhaeribacter aquaticus]
MSQHHVKIHDKTFQIYISERQILQTVEVLAARISHDYKHKRPLFLAVLNGAFMFASDLLKEVSINCEISFVKLSSYEDMGSTGHVTEVIGLKEDISQRHVIILEDIVDSGRTLYGLQNTLADMYPASVEIAALLVKPDALQHPLQVKYTGRSIPNDFVVGYGLDYNGLGRNLRDLYKVTDL